SPAGVRCLRNWVSECGENGVRWGDKCYYVDTSVLVTHAQAREFCSTKGARLLSITSQNESDFLSELLETLARDTVGLHTGGVRTQVFGDTFWLWQNSSTRPAPSLPFTLWWPGWNVTVGVQQNGNQRVTDEDVKNGDVMSEESVTQCILSDCAQKLHFVCETDKIDVGCIEDRGMTYAGTANITVDGEPCLPWKDPHVQPKIRDFTQTRGLTNNYCANPDGDDIPWCFTSIGRANFCDIPRCERKETHHEIVENVCPSHMFACASGGCIHQEWQCDGQKDCNDNSDEQECQDYSEEFTKLANHRLVGEEVEKWLYTLRVACAARCVQAKNFICMSFNYEQASETCILSKGNVGLSGGLVSSGGWEYHEMRKLVVNCSNMFVCGDGKCIDAAQNCDGRRDCKKGEDEMDCEDKVNFEVRLANGSDVHEGRVEVKAFRRWGGVCHDMWGELEGDVVCRQLGFSLGAREVLLNSHFGSSRGQYLMDDLNCQGNEASLAECDFGGWGVHDCQASEGAGVRCYKVGDECSREQWQCSNGRCIGLPYLCDTVDDCHDGSDEERGMCQAPLEVRLVDGKDMEEVARGEGELKKRQGRVEVRYLGIWGTVCDDDITLEEGHCCYLSTRPQTDTTDSVPPDGPLPESLPSTCGLREVDDNPTTSIVARVVSGHTPPPGAHPWMVAINLLTRTGPTQWCGGAVLGEEYVLTAGHCVFKYPATTYLLKIGDFNTHEEEEEEQEFRVSAVVLHPEYDKGPYLNNDIALLKVEKKNGRGIQFGRFVQPLCMVPSRWKYPPYLNCTVAGWGSLGVTLGYSKVLQSALLPILPEETCEADHVYGPARLTQGMYCAGHMEGGIDTCQGDSGGPMVCFVEGRYTAVGITSWGHGCARPNKPGVYTKLSRYIPWIYSNMR
ncbi:Neurotrypsin-like 1, partial [Homarus americanus]